MDGCFSSSKLINALSFSSDEILTDCFVLSEMDSTKKRVVNQIEIDTFILSEIHVLLFFFKT